MQHTTGWLASPCGTAGTCWSGQRPAGSRGGRSCGRRASLSAGEAGWSTACSRTHRAVPLSSAHCRQPLYMMSLQPGMWSALHQHCRVAAVCRSLSLQCCSAGSVCAQQDAAVQPAASDGGLPCTEHCRVSGRVPQLKSAALSPTAQAASAHSRMQLVSLRQGAVACPAWSTAGPWQSAEAGQSEPHGQSQALAPRTARRAASLQFVSTAGCNRSACTRRCTRHCRPLARCCS